MDIFCTAIGDDGIARGPSYLYCVSLIQFLYHSSIHHCLHIVPSLCPLLLCKSSVQSGNAEQCTLAFIHLLSSSCTSYFYNISYMFVLFVNASVWQYCQQHSECILSDSGPIILIICIVHVFTVLVVQLNSLYFIMQSMSNHCI